MKLCVSFAIHRLATHSLSHLPLSDHLLTAVTNFSRTSPKMLFPQIFLDRKSHLRFPRCSKKFKDPTNPARDRLYYISLQKRQKRFALRSYSAVVTSYKYCRLHSGGGSVPNKKWFLWTLSTMVTDWRGINLRHSLSRSL